MIQCSNGKSSVMRDTNRRFTVLGYSRVNVTVEINLFPHYFEKRNPSPKSRHAHTVEAENLKPVKLQRHSFTVLVLLTYVQHC